MNLLYIILINLIASLLPSIGVFNKRVKRFLELRKDTFKKIKLRCRIDTIKELEYFKAGGILQYVLNSIIDKAS